MQPLKIRLNRSSGSTIGCDPSTLRSMIDNRRWPNATGPRHQTPQPSGPSRRQDGADPVYRGDVGIFPVAAHFADQSAHLCSPLALGCALRCCLPPRSGLTRVSDISGRLWGLPALARRPGSIGLRLTDARGGVLRSRSAAPSGCCLPPRSGLTRVSDISGRLWGLPALARRPGSIGLRLADARGGVLRSRSAAPSGCCLPPRSGLMTVSDVSGRLWGLPALARRPGSIGLRLADARGGVLRSRSAAPSGCCLPPRSGLMTVSDVSGRLWGLPALARRPGSIGLRLADARGGVLRSRSAAP